jgi:hypothetical protein
MASLTATMHKNNAPKTGWAKTLPLVASSWFLSFEFQVSVCWSDSIFVPNTHGPRAATMHENDSLEPG